MRVQRLSHSVRVTFPVDHFETLPESVQNAFEHFAIKSFGIRKKRIFYLVPATFAVLLDIIHTFHQSRVIEPSLN